MYSIILYSTYCWGKNTVFSLYHKLFIIKITIIYTFMTKYSLYNGVFINDMTRVY